MDYEWFVTSFKNDQYALMIPILSTVSALITNKVLGVLLKAVSSTQSPCNISMRKYSFLFQNK